jgi:hypothetical protein
MIEEIHHLKNQEEDKEFIQMIKFPVHLFQCLKFKIINNNTKDRNLIGKIKKSGQCQITIIEDLNNSQKQFN